MAKPFDATLKELIQTYPADWMAQFGLPFSAPLEMIESDLSTVSALADKVFRARSPEPWLLHIEFQASRDRSLDRRLLKYSALLYERHGLPIHSVVILLRPEANAPELTGALRYAAPTGGYALDFRYQVIRVWEQPVEMLLSGGLGVLPLAPLAAVSQAELPQVIRQLEARIETEAEPGEASVLWTSTYVLMGLRYPPSVATQLLLGVQGMRESSTYQAILAEGRMEGRTEGRAEGQISEARRILLILGEARFGTPDAGIRNTIETTDSVERLEHLTRRLLTVSTWQELLADAEARRTER